MKHSYFERMMTLSEEDAEHKKARKRRAEDELNRTKARLEEISASIKNGNPHSDQHDDDQHFTATPAHTTTSMPSQRPPSQRPACPQHGHDNCLEEPGATSTATTVVSKLIEKLTNEHIALMEHISLANDRQHKLENRMESMAKLMKEIAGKLRGLQDPAEQAAEDLVSENGRQALVEATKSNRRTVPSSFRGSEKSVATKTASRSSPASKMQGGLRLPLS